VRKTATSPRIAYDVIGNGGPRVLLVMGLGMRGKAWKPQLDDLGRDHSLAFFDHRDGTLIAGDAFSTKAGIVTGGSLRLLFPFHALATWHKPTTLRSAEALRALQPARLAVGHGAVLENPVPAMEQAIAEARHHIKSSDYASQKAY